MLYLNPRNGNILTDIGGLIFGILYTVINDPPEESEFPQINRWKNYAKAALIALPSLWALTYILIPFKGDPICVS